MKLLSNGCQEPLATELRVIFHQSIRWQALVLRIRITCGNEAVRRIRMFHSSHIHFIPRERAQSFIPHSLLCVRCVRTHTRKSMPKPLMPCTHKAYSGHSDRIKPRASAGNDFNIQWTIEMVQGSRRRRRTIQIRFPTI